jgi:hypothetical protein
VPSRRRNDDRSIGRRGPTREPKRRILIVCEGEVTEPGYFRAFQHAVRNRRVHVEIARQHGVPMTIVEIAVRLHAESKDEARRQRDDNLLWDEVWGVFDVDEHPNLEQACRLAVGSGILLAVSNPCFELWALLHFQDQRAHIERHRVRAELQQVMPGYDKDLDFERMHQGYDAAVRRAVDLVREAGHHGELMRNPTTGVVRLTESIRCG